MHFEDYLKLEGKKNVLNGDICFTLDGMIGEKLLVFLRRRTRDTLFRSVKRDFQTGTHSLLTKENRRHVENGFLLTGVLFGLTAGITPGPLLSLVITETLKHGRGEGLKIAAAPLITDAPIVSLIVYILTSLPRNHFFIGLLSLLGACYVIYLGIKNIRVKRIPEGKQSRDRENALLQGIVTNALNPHPYIFWISIGAPMMSRALSVHPYNAVLFILSFYALLVGSKVGITFAVDIFKAFLRSRYYLIIIRILGVTLIVFGLFFIWDGIRILRTAQL